MSIFSRKPAIPFIALGHGRFPLPGTGTTIKIGKPESVRSLQAAMNAAGERQILLGLERSRLPSSQRILDDLVPIAMLTRIAAAKQVRTDFAVSVVGLRRVRLVRLAPGPWLAATFEDVSEIPSSWRSRMDHSLVWDLVSYLESTDSGLAAALRQALRAAEEDSLADRVAGLLSISTAEVADVLMARGTDERNKAVEEFLSARVSLAGNAHREQAARRIERLGKLGLSARQDQVEGIVARCPRGHSCRLNAFRRCRESVGDDSCDEELSLTYRGSSFHICESKKLATFHAWNSLFDRCPICFPLNAEASVRCRHCGHTAFASIDVLGGCCTGCKREAWFQNPSRG